MILVSIIHMQHSKIINVIDIGTLKVTTLVGQYIDDEDKFNIVAVSSIPSLGFRKGQIINLDQASKTITQSIESAERMAGFQINSAHISISAPHIESINSHGVVAISNSNGEIDANGFSKGTVELGLESAMQFIPEALEGEAPVQINLKNELGVSIELGKEGLSDVYIKDKVSGDVASNIERDTKVETTPGMIDKFGNVTKPENVDLVKMINHFSKDKDHLIIKPSSVSLSADNRWCVNTGHTTSKGTLSGLKSNAKK